MEPRQFLFAVFLFAVRVCLFVVLRRSVRAVLLLHRDGVGVLRTVLLLRMASARMLFVIFVSCGTLCLRLSGAHCCRLALGSGPQRTWQWIYHDWITKDS